jgi:hypothetical protein
MNLQYDLPLDTCAGGAPSLCVDDVAGRSKDHHRWWPRTALLQKKVVETEKTLDNWLECSIYELKKRSMRVAASGTMKARIERGTKR